MFYRVNLADFAKQKIFYYQKWGSHFLIIDGIQYKENLPKTNAYTIRDDTGEDRLLTIEKKPTILAPRGTLKLSVSKHVPVSLSGATPALPEIRFGRLYTPNEVFALLLSVMVWLPGNFGIFGPLLGLFIAFKSRPILLSELPFSKKLTRIILYHIAGVALCVAIAALAKFVQPI